MVVRTGYILFTVQVVIFHVSPYSSTISKATKLYIGGYIIKYVLIAISKCYDILTTLRD